ncbi:MAG: ATP-binding protein [Microcystaceae cyanobacterium]
METLIVDGVLESLDDIAQYILALGKEVGLDKKKVYKLRLAVDELATNIIVYGYKEIEPKGKIKVEAQWDNQALTVILEDTAPAFDPSQNWEQAELLLSMPVAERPIGGLGIYLAVDGVDRFSYERVGDCNRSILGIDRVSES